MSILENFTGARGVLAWAGWKGVEVGVGLGVEVGVRVGVGVSVGVKVKVAVGVANRFAILLVLHPPNDKSNNPNKVTNNP